MFPIQNDVALLALLLGLLALVFYAASHPNKYLRGFFSLVPALLLCYFLPSLLPTLGVVDISNSKLYEVVKTYLLPTALVLLTLSIDLKLILKLGPKAAGMFLAGTIGIVLGGPIALFICTSISPDIAGGLTPDQLWRGLSTIAGSWIGGGANQVAMKEVFQVEERVFSAMLTVDIIVANLMMGALLFGVGQKDKIDRKLKADTSAIEALTERMEQFRLQTQRPVVLSELAILLGIVFGVTGISYQLANWLAPLVKLNSPALAELGLDSPFFWLVILATTGGVLLSQTRVRNMEGVGASTLGSMMIYLLVATIGLKMNVLAIGNAPGLFIIGIVWMLVHVVVMAIVARLIRAPYFFIAVGSQANVGGAASAPVVASAFHPSLAPVGVLLAVLGYALGTYGAWLCAILMRAATL
jgi:uncharacterized membrane protein